MEEKSKQKQKDNQISKMERLLSVHSLEGLVYEKRERKQTVNQFTSIYKPNTHQHQKQKPLNMQPTKDKKQIKNQKKVTKRKVSKEQKNTKIQKRGSKIKQKKLQKSCQKLKKRGRPKKSIVQEQKSLNPRKKAQQVEQKSDENQENQEQQSQNQSQQQSELESVQQSNYNNQIQQVRTNKNIPEKPSKVIKNKPKRLQQKMKKQISQQQSQQKQDVQNKNGTILQNKNDIKVIQKQHQQQAIVKGFRKFNKLNQDLQQIKQQKYEDKDIQQAQQNQPENKNQQVPKAHKITKIYCISEIKKNQQISIPEKKKNQQANNKAIQQKSSGKRLLRIRRKNIDHLNVKNIIHAHDQQNQNEKKRKTGLRRTKNQVQKKYVVFQGQSQEQEVQNYEAKKRKVGNDKQYMINRIFRKTQKANLPNVQIQVDLTKFSLQNFAQKFKVFDMVHCSLPLQMLMKLTDFSSLIFKGFVFIWVQKGQIQIGYHWLNRNGFDVIDQIMWVKTNQSMNQVVYDQDTKGQIFPNCRSTCLVGYKCSLNQKTQYCTKISNNIIFAPQKYLSIQKPQEIFQIGDLMMPGARKLQLGSKQLGGWFTLKHKQKSFARCHYCLRRDFRSLYMTKQMVIICQICQVRKQRMQKLQQSNYQQPQQQKQNLVQIKLSDIDISNLYPLEYVQIKFLDSLWMFCYACKIKKQSQLFQIIEKVQNQSVQPEQKKIWCKYCIRMPSIYCKIKVYNFEEVYFARKQIKCTKCLKQCLYKQYYQCFSCKNAHIICSKCMMSVQQNKNQNDGDEELKNHDWKLKLVYQTPQFKANCFQCKQQCAIPYWSCQICQNFYWCGKCKHTEIPKHHLHHCHYTRKHHLSLII